MPRIFRAMVEDGQVPMIGHTDGAMLGVRECDVTIVEGLVQPKRGGMSVSPTIADLPPHLIPKRLRAKYPDARRGTTKPDTLPWRFGAGAFEAGPLCDKLVLTPDLEAVGHGYVETDLPMPLQEHRAAVEATQPSWTQEQW